MAKEQRKKRTTNNALLINKEQFGKLMEKLDALIKVTAASLFRGEKLIEGIIFLSDLGFTAKEVAQILGTTDGYVGNVKSEAKKPKKKPETPEKDKTPEQGTPTTVQ